MKKRILFVDDQPNILTALRRMLRSLRDEWDMEFSESGSDALDRLGKTPFDVVVSDMRMPGMDGAQLLDEVMRHYPETVRIILSGQSEQAAIMRTIGPAHQFLSKPCDPELLKSTVARACALRDRLAEPLLIKFVSQVTTLPCLPDVYAKLIEELQSPDASIQRVAELISRDVAMTAKLMQLVNSSFFGLPRRVESPAHAVSLLGLNLLEPLVLSAGIFSEYEDHRMEEYSLDALVEHSLAVSTLAQRIAASFIADEQGGDEHLVGDSLLAGLLHDVGQLVAVTNLPLQYRKTLAVARDNQIPLCEAEVNMLGGSHADIGAYLLGLWGLPDSIIEAVAFHHDPSKCPHAQFTPLTAVHVANTLVNQAQRPSEIRLDLQLDLDYLERMDVTAKLPQWQEMAQTVTPEGTPV